MPKDFLVENSEVGKKALQLSRIILLSMVSGEVIFLGLVVFVIRGMVPAPGALPLVSYIAGFMAAMNLVLSAVIPGLTLIQVRKQAAAQPDFLPEELLGVYQTQMIVSAALLEGAAFFNTIAYMIEQQWWTLGTVGVLLVAMLQKFPTAGRLESFVRTQSELIELQKSQK